MTVDPTAEHVASWLGRLLIEADEPSPTWAVDVNADGQKLWLTVDDGEEYQFIVAVWEVDPA